MRTVLLSDIHGNLPALEAVIDALPEADEVIVAGDHCLDGPHPAEVWDRLRLLGWGLVMGNTDRDIVSDPAELEGKKRANAIWSSEALGPSRLAEISQLPFSLSAGAASQVLVVHANPLNLHQHLYPTLSETELRPYLEGVGQPIVAFGHYHVPYTRPVLDHLLINVASVGHPKDHDLRSAFTVIEWDGEIRKVSQIRVPYDIDRTLRAYRESDMPEAEKQIKSLLKASY